MNDTVQFFPPVKPRRCINCGKPEAVHGFFCEPCYTSMPEHLREVAAQFEHMLKDLGL
jgi:hypothetical protein